MAQVVVLDSLNEDIFVCGFCKLVFNSLQLFLDHKKHNCGSDFESSAVGSEGLSQTMDVYSKSSNENVSNILQNSESASCTPILSETLTDNLSCDICSKTFKTAKSLQTHIKTHSERPYQCPICGRCFIQNSHLHRHIVSHKVWPDGLTETTAKSSEIELLSYSCSYCTLVLPNYSQFRSHLKNHLSLKKFKCIQGDCIGLFPNIDDLLCHTAKSHRTVFYPCHICNEKFDTLEKIARHQQNHENIEKSVIKGNNEQFKCLQCDAIFKKPEKLTLHMLTESHKKVCIHCNKIFASDKRLRLHLQIHRNLKPFHCNICGSSFHMKKYLSSHLLCHGEKQFSCSVCKHTFKRKDLLQRHMKCHQTKKMFKCPFQDTLGCKKEFSRSDKLKSHVKFHTKRMLTNSTSQNRDSLDRVQENAGTVEICIVPLDPDIITK